MAGVFADKEKRKKEKQMEKDTIQINRLLNTPGSHSVRR
jgi:hypothetical protein